VNIKKFYYQSYICGSDLLAIAKYDAHKSVQRVPFLFKPLRILGKIPSQSAAFLAFNELAGKGSFGRGNYAFFTKMHLLQVGYFNR